MRYDQRTPVNTLDTPLSLPGSTESTDLVHVLIPSFRRLQVAPTSTMPGVRRLEVTQFAGEEVVADDRVRLVPGLGPAELLTAHRADRMTISNLGAPVEVEITDLGARPVTGSHLFLIGAMKSATTSLYDHLVQHPAIARNHTAKEPSFFDTPSDLDHRDYYSQYRYDPRLHRWALDGSTNYTKQYEYPGVPQRIAQLPGDAKFIYLMRDPVSRTESHIAHNVARRNWDIDNLDPVQVRRCVDVSSYARQLDEFARVFDDFRERLVLIDFHDVIHALPRVLRKIEQFCELPPHDYAFLPASNVRRSDRGANKVRLTQEQREQFWQQLAGEPERLRTEYGFIPRVPWSQPARPA